MKPVSTVEEMDAAVEALQQHKAEWARLPIASRLGYLEMLIRDFAAVSVEWVKQVTSAQQIVGNDHAIGTEWMQGPYAVLRNLQCLRQSFQEIQSVGHPKIPGKITTRPKGQVSAQVFSQTFYDQVLFSGYRV